MARTRNIKPSFFMNEELAACSALSRLLFVGLWTIADRSGRVHDKPRKIRAEVLPYQDNCDCDELLEELNAAGFIQRYEVDGCKYLWIKNFEKHQRPHPKEPKSEIPPFSGSAVEKHGKKFLSTAEPEKETEECAFPSSNPYPSNPSISNASDNHSREKFRHFWDEYPLNQDGKKPDREACFRTFALLPPHQQDQVIIGVTHYQGSREVRDGFPMKPLRFLDSGWHDWQEPAKPTEVASNGPNKLASLAELEEMNNRAREHAERRRRRQGASKP